MASLSSAREQASSFDDLMKNQTRKDVVGPVEHADWLVLKASIASH